MNGVNFVQLRKDTTKAHLFLALLFVLEVLKHVNKRETEEFVRTYLVERSVIPLVCCEASQSGQLLAVLYVLHSAKLEYGTIYFYELLELFVVLLGHTGKELKYPFHYNLFHLPKETSGLECLSGNVQWQVLG